MLHSAAAVNPNEHVLYRKNQKFEAGTSRPCSGPAATRSRRDFQCALWVSADTMVQDIAAACSDTPECDFLVYYPLGRSLGGDPAQTPSGVLKTARAGADASQLRADEGDLLEPKGYDQRKSFNPLAVAYFKCARLSPHQFALLLATDLWY